ncbi:MAG TPA: hypothetical protein PLO67_18690 [Saprospiraceae bacterium]|nr:hypothetical protein [Saprospiraceae bacterium]HPI08509.1 hypothetical protein [Saprospiraceae bacterium]
MTDMQANKDERLTQKVEEMGVFFERLGRAPMSGRVLAYLLLSEPPHQDFFEIQAFLKASKSAVSNALNYLMQEGTIDYITFSGDRRRYFRINPTGWLNNLKNGLRQVTILRHLLEGVLHERTHSAYPAFDEELKKIVAFNVFIAEGIERNIAEWERQHGEGT